MCFYAVYAPPPWSGKRKRDLVAFKIDWRCSTVVEFEYLTFRGNVFDIAKIYRIEEFFFSVKQRIFAEGCLTEDIR